MWLIITNFHLIFWSTWRLWRFFFYGSLVSFALELMTVNTLDTCVKWSLSTDYQHVCPAAFWWLQKCINSRNRRDSETSILYSHSALSYLNETPTVCNSTPTCAPCVLSWAPKYHTDRNSKISKSGKYQHSNAGCRASLKMVPAVFLVSFISRKFFFFFWFIDQMWHHTIWSIKLFLFKFSF